MTQRDKIFIPLLDQFVSNNFDALINSGYPWAPFIPYEFFNYNLSPKKIFYVGIDTYYWSTTPSDLLNAYFSRNYSALFDKNDGTVTTSRVLLEWRKGKGPFWEFICKMQIYMLSRTLKTTDDLRYLSPQEAEFINELGYGNCNHIELPKTLESEGNWDGINENLYWKLSDSAKEIFSPIKNIIESFEPDVIFILGADENDDYIFKGLKYKHLDCFDEDKWRKLYTIKGNKVKIIKTYHPRAFCRQGSNNDEMVEYLYQSLNLFP